MVDVEKLKTIIEKRELTVRNIADKIGIDVSTLYRKLQKGGDSFTIKEASQLTEILSLDRKEAQKIFFGEKVANMR